MKIDRIREVPPTPGSDRGAAYAVHLDSGSDPHCTVEYAAAGGGIYASPGHARRLVQEYLDRDEMPPRRILVSRDGGAQPSDD